MLRHGRPHRCRAQGLEVLRRASLLWKEDQPMKKTCILKHTIVFVNKKHHASIVLASGTSRRAFMFFQAVQACFVKTIMP